MKSDLGCWALLLLIYLSCFISAEAKVYRHKVAKTYEGETRFLTKFAFNNLKESGIVSIFVDLTTNVANQSLLLIKGYDEYFDIMKNDDLTCLQKRNYSTIALPIDQEIEPGLYNLITGIPIVSESGGSAVYAVLEGCGLERMILLSQRIEFYQENRGQFSSEDSGMVGIYSFFFSVFLIGALIHVYGQFVLARSMTVHPIYRFLTCSILLELFGIMFHLIHYCVYRKNGIGASGLETLGEIFEMAAQILFVALLLLIAQGWSISSDEMSQQTPLFIFTGLYSLFYMIYFGVNASIQETPYFKTQYQEAPGGLLLAFRCIIFFYFVYCLRRTYRTESSTPKRELYKKIGIAFSIWLITLPFLIAIVSGSSSLYNVKKSTTISLLIYEAFGLLVMAVMLWPSKTYTYFNLDSVTSYPTDSVPDEGYTSDKGAYGSF